jgi:hypothetical protein
MALLPTKMEVVDVEDPIMHPYCGPKHLKPSLAYTPFKKFNNKDFVLMKPHDLFLIPMWMGRPQCDVVKDDENKNFKIMKAQWWGLMVQHFIYSFPFLLKKIQQTKIKIIFLRNLLFELKSNLKL